MYTSLEISKRLYELSGWLDPSVNGYSHTPKAPYYTVGFLFNKLPTVYREGLESFYLGMSKYSDTEYQAYYEGIDTIMSPGSPLAETPEDAIGLLAIKMFEEGILK